MKTFSEARKMYDGGRAAKTGWNCGDCGAEKNRSDQCRSCGSPARYHRNDPVKNPHLQKEDLKKDFQKAADAGDNLRKFVKSKVKKFQDSDTAKQIRQKKTTAGVKPIKESSGSVDRMADTWNDHADHPHPKVQKHIKKAEAAYNKKDHEGFFHHTQRAADHAHTLKKNVKEDLASGRPIKKPVSSNLLKRRAQENEKALKSGFMKLTPAERAKESKRLGEGVVGDIKKTINKEVKKFQASDTAKQIRKKKTTYGVVAKEAFPDLEEGKKPVVHFKGEDKLKTLKIKLNPKKKIGVKVTDIGPGGKEVVRKNTMDEEQQRIVESLKSRYFDRDPESNSFNRTKSKETTVRVGQKRDKKSGKMVDVMGKTNAPQGLPGMKSQKKR